MMAKPMKTSKLYYPTIQVLKEQSQGILSYFYHRQNYHSIEGNLKIILYKDRKTTKQ